MLPAVNRGAGKNIGFPDVCMTPAGMAVVPVPYPNQAAHAMAIGFSPNVFLSGKSALNVASIIPMTAGDEGGTAHPMIKQMGRFTQGSPIVAVNNLPGIHLLCPTTGNNMNNGVGAVLQTGITNVFYTYSVEMTAALSAGEVESVERELAPAERESPPLTWCLEEGGIGLVRIEVFSADIPARLFHAVTALEREGACSLVIDLRGNPGGAFSAFVEAASLFLPAGTKIATFVDAEGDRTPHLCFTEEPCELPVVLIVDEQTASAAELFAECLSVHERATLVGGPMYGKRTAQRMIPCGGGSAARVPAGHVEVGV
ncbi:MAG: S41 family peptidase [Polyangiaceae bacterium]